MRGDNFTQEYKYPLKLYRIWKFESSNGIELRKLIIGVVTASMVILAFFILGATTSNNAIIFLLNNWAMMLVGIPGLITYIVFSLKYDNKPFISFFRDRWDFYKNRNKAFEHFDEVPLNQYETDLEFEAFDRIDRKEDSNGG
ncbi:hypothetical protein J26TS2_44880 [Shouchella clausii]|nr:hypothetical protein J26TS2_44880 [Shouchella clausii]